MCGSGPAWKREKVPDHKFDFVDTREFTDNGFGMRMKYLWLYVVVLKSFLVYVSDIFSATTMLSTDNWSNEIFANCVNVSGCIPIPFNVGKWLFVGCIIFSFLLLAYEARKSKKIIASRDISYAFTNVMANNYYSLRSYDHFCFFSHISNSTKTSDDFAFFVFFTFKTWKRLLLADGPRQTINALTLYSIYLSKQSAGHWYDVPKYFQNNSLSTSALTVTTFFTCTIFLGSLLILIVAAICYIPLLCRIQGNLKEYCCHKVDKRINTVIKRRQKQRLADAAKLARKEAEGDFSHLKNKKGEMIAQPLPQPTLPNISIEDDFDDVSSVNTRQPAASTYTQDYNYYYNSDKAADYPPMPAYNPYSHHQGSSHQYNPSQQTLPDDQSYPYAYEEENESTANLTASAAPFAHYGGPGVDRSRTPMAYGQTQGYDPRDVYQGRGTTPAPADPYRGQTPALPDPYRGHTPALPDSYHQTTDTQYQRDPSPAPAEYSQPAPEYRQHAGSYGYDDGMGGDASSLQVRRDAYGGYASQQTTPQAYQTEHYTQGHGDYGQGDGGGRRDQHGTAM